MEIMIITGMSGAGKSKAINALEDAGYYCVDNMPPQFMTEVAEFFRGSEQKGIQRIAMVVDARSREMFHHLTETLDEMKQGHLRYKILFLDASTEVLLQRYRESRRRHPMIDEDTTSLQEAIQEERDLLAPLLAAADYVIDTSLTIPAQLRERVVGIVEESGLGQQMAISFMSFGFRNGLPPEADLVFDVRCLPNPFYIPELRAHHGDEPAVRDYVMQFPESQELMKKLEDLLGFLVPLYVREGRSQLVVAVGCTGGKHRSVATAIRLGEYIRSLGYGVAITHRDKEKAEFR